MMLCIYKRYWSVRSIDSTSYRPRAMPSFHQAFRRILALKESAKAPRSRNLWEYTLTRNLDSRLQVRTAQVCVRVCCVGQGLSFLCLNVICWHHLTDSHWWQTVLYCATDPEIVLSSTDAKIKAYECRWPWHLIPSPYDRWVRAVFSPIMSSVASTDFAA